MILFIFLILISCKEQRLTETPMGSPSSEQTDSILDITNAFLSKSSNRCVDYLQSYIASVTDINLNSDFSSMLVVDTANGECIFTSNGIPNHNFNNGVSHFITDVIEQSQVYKILVNPSITSELTILNLKLDNAIFLNGVKLDILSAGCFGVGNGKIGCGNISTPWRFDPAFPNSTFRVDQHNAHTQPDGSYHYHASPQALFNPNDSTIISPVIGFAADGFPIYGSFFNDNGNIRKAQSSYRLRVGARQEIDGVNPGGSYDGTYRDDYEYIENHGDLDECNGMIVNENYGYYITDSYPWVLGCFKGDPHKSFLKE